jgi:hypothetical protein
VALLAITSIAAIGAAPARASLGYELNAAKPSQSLGSKVPHGIAVDQTSRRIYVAIVTGNAITGTPGEIDKFESDFSSAGTLLAGSEPFYTGVAVNPVTQGVFGAQAIAHTPAKVVGTAKMDIFTSSGTAGTPFALSDTGTLPQIGADSAGHVYYPNALTHSVQVFDSAGTALEEITCSSCTGGGFGKPISVALDSADNLYVVDLSPDRVVKLVPSGGHYVFASVLQSGRGAVGVGVDPSDNSVLVGDLPGGSNYHVIAYNSSGTQFDDFGAGVFTEPPPAEFGPTWGGQIAVDGTSHRVYVGEKDDFFIFNRVMATPPTASVETASPVGQLSATPRASVDANGHAALECEFEYTDDSDFQANEFSNALAQPCATLPAGTAPTKVESKVAGLTPSTIYHYRVSTTTNAGSVTSGALSFETLPVLPPTVTTEPVQAVTGSSATLKAKVNPRGGTVSNCHFEYGTGLSYGTNLSCPSLPEAVATDVAESRNISKLVAGTIYHYRLVVTSNAGTTKGNDIEFTTTSSTPPSDPGGGDTPTTTPAATSPPLPPIVTPPAPKRLTCKKGFRKKRVRGKVKCVKKKPAKRRHSHR